MTLPSKQPEHISTRDISKYADRFHLVPGQTLSGYYPKRHRTMLDHPCWFSKKPHIQRLSVAQAIQQHPDYMLWVYNNLSINWSEHVIERLEELKKSWASFEWLAR
jgi:hypothetical protein